jgi:hypothetical protein
LLHCAVDTELEVVRDETSGVATATIVKQRDGPTEGEFVFRLHQVELGRNLDGDLVTSCVVEPVEQPAGAIKKKRAPLSGQQSIAMQQLDNAIITAGTIPPFSTHIPPNTRCVDEAVWRSYCYSAGISSGKDRARQQAFNRAATALQKINRIGRWNELIWAVPQ